jgi:hypothetical protein
MDVLDKLVPALLGLDAYWLVNQTLQHAAIKSE